MNQAHDHSYKLLFSEPEVVVDLLQGFVHVPWIGELDFSTLEKVSGSGARRLTGVRMAHLKWLIFGRNAGSAKSRLGCWVFAEPTD